MPTSRETDLPRITPNHARHGTALHGIPLLRVSDDHAKDGLSKPGSGTPVKPLTTDPLKATRQTVRTPQSDLATGTEEPAPENSDKAPEI